MDPQQIVSVLNATGVNMQDPISSINWVNLIIGTFFGIIGLYAFNQGRKNREWRPTALGVALMGYTFFVSTTLWTILIGSALTGAFYFWRE